MGSYLMLGSVGVEVRKKFMCKSMLWQKCSCWDVLSVGVCANGKWRVHNLDGQRELLDVRGRTRLLLQTGTIQE